ncbi:MAG TPA: O-methyltransferase [candidate division Zixibacteria bacterium]|nr:O-methyltransferase [candidate division Zixibacteria bacterium]MDD4916377.1 O-methyltransferase [candidate division Zixibacteria bacterium]MDM7972837.1 O-methyltransferase [candidate division Zixibacteria bacterium]HOD67696.1 O-methyltransferase [candidate division Zixibacteria bacterium]HPM37682.1 O-methyltransferase [candidate division Zixibacteria bacterium]
MVEQATDLFAKVHRYLEEIAPPRPPVMREMEAYAAEHGFPIVGPLVGRFLYQLAMLTKARRVMELGSGFGYSAYWFSLAMGGRGEIVMTDADRRNKRRANDYFMRAGLESRFDFQVGNALRLLERQDGPFDIVFNDVDKEDYPRTIELAAPRLRKGGLFLTDNAIWSGRVADGRGDAPTQAVRAFNAALVRDSRFWTTIVPIRDGVAVALRL